MVQARFDSTDRHFRDRGNFFQREILDDVKQQSRTLKIGQLLKERKENITFLATNKRGTRVQFVSIRKIVGRFKPARLRRENRRRSVCPTPLLEALLMGDTEKPGGKLGVLPQTGDVPDGADKSFLNDIERRCFILEKFGGIGVKRQLKSFEQGIPCFRRLLAGGVEKMGIGDGHVGYLRVECEKTKKVQRLIPKMHLNLELTAALTG